MTTLSASGTLDSPHSVAASLAAANYLADDATSSLVYLAARLQKPLLVEGPAGTGKTELAKSVAAVTGSRLIRLQCYEGLDEARALYEWNYKKQLLRIHARQVAHDETAGSSVSEQQSWHALEDDIFSEEFLLERPLLAAIRSAERAVLLVDEVDRLDVETEALLLEVISEYQVSIPELGTIQARSTPLVFLTSNNSRELSEALKRRCLFLHLGYPSMEREAEILMARVPGLPEAVARQVAQIVESLRAMDLKKAPSVSEALDWARTLVLLGVDDVVQDDVLSGLPLLLKNQSDITETRRVLTTAP